jgi:phosphoenolpyruvate-protein phosphotransferase
MGLSVAGESSMRRLRGAAASPGIASGPSVHLVLAPRPAGRRIAPAEAPAELERFRAAVTVTAQALEELAARVSADGHPDEGAIFRAQAAMARDPALADLVETQIRDGGDAIAGLGAAAADLAGQLRGLGDELLSARAADVEDVAGRMIDVIAGSGPPPTLDRPSIVVANDLPPSLTASLPRERLLGIALETGSPTAHAAILARAYGIPAVVGIAGLLAALDSTPGKDVQLIIDGDAGEVVLDPDESTAAWLRERTSAAALAAEQALAEATLAAITRDGVEVTLLANIGTPAESERAVALGAKGVGLFRTEFLFIERSTPPSEAEQVRAYRTVVEAFAPHPVTIRLLDVGGDKPIPYLPIPPEANPFLGVRALRLAPERPDLFVTQLRAAMRAAAPRDDGPLGPLGPLGPVKVMAPMIADATDTDVLLALADRARTELELEGVPHGPVGLGVMLEIPSAILVGDSYFGRLGFASLGTNDLLQYTIAVDRGNSQLARYQDSLHPAVLRLVREAVERTGRAGIELSVCGEMAGDPAAALALVGLGIRQLSMAAPSLAAVRRAIRSSDHATLEHEALAALDRPSAGAVRERFMALLPAD